MKRRFLKSIAILTTLTFVFPYLTWAFEPGAYPIAARLLSIQYQGKPIELPANLGTIEKVFQGQNKTIIHIQDLHCNHEVQKNIAQIIHRLAKDHGLKLVGEEGAFFSPDISPLRSFPIPEIREAVSDYFVKQGKLTGAEYYGGNGEYPIRLEGIETSKLYEDSLAAVRSFLNAESQGYLLDLREMLDGLKPGIYSPDLTAVDQARSEYREGKLDVLAYAARLKKMAGQHHINPALYPNLEKYLHLGQKRFEPSVEPDSLFHDLEALDRALREALYTQDLQREFDTQYHRLDVMEKLLNISATQEEVRAFKSGRTKFSVKAMIDFIQSFDRHPGESRGPEGNGPDSGLRRNDDEAAWEPRVAALEIDPEIYGLEQYLNKVEEFYSLADIRSRHFIANLNKKMDAEHETLAVVITGGFHTESMLDELKKQGVGYISVKPRLTKQDVANPYFSILQGKKLPIEKLLAKNQTLLAPRVWPESATFVSVWGITFGPIAHALIARQKPDQIQSLRNYLAQNKVQVEQITGKAAIDLGLGKRVPAGCEVCIATTPEGKKLPVLVANQRVFTQAVRRQISYPGDYQKFGDFGLAVFAEEDWRGLDRVVASIAKQQSEIGEHWYSVNVSPYLETPKEMFRQFSAIVQGNWTTRDLNFGQKTMRGLGMISLFAALPVGLLIALVMVGWIVGEPKVSITLLEIFTIYIVGFSGNARRLYEKSVIGMHRAWNQVAPAPWRLSEELWKTGKMNYQQASELIDQVKYAGDEELLRQVKEPAKRREVVSKLFQNGVFYVQNSRKLSRHTKCSGRCWYCYAHRIPLMERQGETQPMPINEATAVVDTAIQSGFKEIQFNGEDTLDDEESFWKLIDACKDKDINLSLFTSGFQLMKPGYAADFFQKLKDRTGDIKGLSVNISWDPEKVERIKNTPQFNGDIDAVFKATAGVIDDYLTVFPESGSDERFKYRLAVDCHDAGTGNLALAEERFEAFSKKIRGYIKQSLQSHKKLFFPPGILRLTTPEAVEEGIGRGRVIRQYTAKALFEKMAANVEGLYTYYHKMDERLLAACTYSPFLDLSMGEMVTCIQRQEYPRRAVTPSNFFDVLLKPFFNPRSRHLYLGEKRARRLAMVKQLGLAFALKPELKEEMQVSFEEVEAFLFSDGELMTKIEMLFLLDDILRQGFSPSQNLFRLEKVPEALLPLLLSDEILDAYAEYYREYAFDDEKTRLPSYVQEVQKLKDYLRNNLKDLLYENEVRSITLEIPTTGYSKSASVKKEDAHLPRLAEQALSLENRIKNLISDDKHKRDDAFELISSLAFSQKSVKFAQTFLIAAVSERKLSNDQEDTLLLLIRRWVENRSVDDPVGVGEVVRTLFLSAEHQNTRVKAALLLSELADVFKENDFFDQTVLLKLKETVDGSDDPGLLLMGYRIMLAHHSISETNVSVKLSQIANKIDEFSAAQIKEYNIPDELEKWRKLSHLILPIISALLGKGVRRSLMTELLASSSEGRQILIKQLESMNIHAIQPEELVEYLEMLNTLYKEPETKEKTVEFLNKLPMSAFEEPDVFADLANIYELRKILPAHRAPQMVVFLDVLENEVTMNRRLMDSLQIYKERLGVFGGLMPWLRAWYKKQGMKKFDATHSDATYKDRSLERLRLDRVYRQSAWLIEGLPLIVGGFAAIMIAIWTGFLDLRLGWTILLLTGYRLSWGLAPLWHLLPIEFSYRTFSRSDWLSVGVSIILAAINIWLSFTSVPLWGIIMASFSIHWLLNRITAMMEVPAVQLNEMMSGAEPYKSGGPGTFNLGAEEAQTSRRNLDSFASLDPKIA
ncbi:MAG: radical SAM protein, partial [Desulfobulbaceae bacterium]|nr:radical SAM protein [Desulfobulbaceae bacterium]